jgi:hypothetical protein
VPNLRVIDTDDHRVRGVPLAIRADLSGAIRCVSRSLAIATVCRRIAAWLARILPKPYVRSVRDVS